MKCPLCQTEERITSSKNILKEQKLFRRLTYSCQNKNCPNFDKELHKEEIELEVEKE